MLDVPGTGLCKILTTFAHTSTKAELPTNFLWHDEHHKIPLPSLISVQYTVRYCILKQLKSAHHGSIEHRTNNKFNSRALSISSHEYRSDTTYRSLVLKHQSDYQKDLSMEVVFNFHLVSLRLTALCS